MSSANKNKYGHIKRNSQSGGQAWKWAVMLEDPERPVKDVFDEMLKMDHAALVAEMFPKLVEKDASNPFGRAAHGYIASAARGMLSKVENEMSGVVNTVTSNLPCTKTRWWPPIFTAVISGSMT